MDITLTDVETYASLKQNKQFIGQRIGKNKIRAIILDFIKYIEAKPQEKILIKDVKVKPEAKIAKVSKLEDEIARIKEL